MTLIMAIPAAKSDACVIVADKRKIGPTRGDLSAFDDTMPKLNNIGNVALGISGIFFNDACGGIPGQPIIDKVKSSIDKHSDVKTVSKKLFNVATNEFQGKWGFFDFLVAGYEGSNENPKLVFSYCYLPNKPIFFKGTGPIWCGDGQVAE